MSKKLAYHGGLLAGLLCGSLLVTALLYEMGCYELFSLSFLVSVHGVFAVVSFYLLYLAATMGLKRSFSSPSFVIGLFFSCLLIAGYAIESRLMAGGPAADRSAFPLSLVLSPVFAYTFLLFVESLVKGIQLAKRPMMVKILIVLGAIVLLWVIVSILGTFFFARVDL